LASSSSISVSGRWVLPTSPRFPIYADFNQYFKVEIGIDKRRAASFGLNVSSVSYMTSFLRNSLLQIALGTLCFISHIRFKFNKRLVSIFSQPTYPLGYA
jgi:hypothetical protein